MSEKNGYDVVFTHMKLPAITGLEASLAMEKVNPETVGIPMTAYRHEMNALMGPGPRQLGLRLLRQAPDIESLLKLVDGSCERRQKAGWV
jgi:hypothetical protein